MWAVRLAAAVARADLEREDTSVTWLKNLGAARRHGRVVLVGISAAVGACSSHDGPAIHDSGNAVSVTKAPRARGEPVAAVSAADTKPGEGLPYPGTWTPTMTYDDSLFTIDRPASSVAETRAPDPAYGHPYREVLLTRLPDCKWDCLVSVAIWRDTSGGGVPAVVRALTARDTTPGALDPDGEGTIIDSLPLGTAAAVQLEMSCGDCGTRAILTSYHGWIAKIEYSSDDREGFSPGLTAHLATVARSFRWRK
jgi:hypothetical protein